VADYVPIPDADLEVRDPGTTGIFARLRDNALAIASGGSGAPQFQNAAIANDAVTEAKLATDAVGTTNIVDGAVGNSELASASVNRTKLDTTSQLLSTTIAGGAYDTVDSWNGADYYFFPQIASDDGVTFDCFVAASKTSGGDSGYSVTIENTSGSSGDFTVDIQYVTASPPYDLGDGEIQTFIYLDILRSGQIVKGSQCRDAPWASLGEGIAPDLHIGGKPYKRVRGPLPKGKGADRVAELLARLEKKPELVEVTAAFKNRHMGDRPHPFRRHKGSVVMIDPVGRLAEDLRLLRDDRANTLQLFKRGYIQLDNTPLDRKGPPGVLIVGAKWKNSK
jgi:hypothetical protein